MIQAIKNITPDFIKRLYRVFFPITENHGWFGSYSDWASALKNSLGYDNAVILEKVKASVLKVKNGEAVYERDSVLFDKIEFEPVVLKTFNEYVKANEGNLNLVDFGGSLGSSYFQYKGLIKDFKSMKWNVVEQAHFVSCGNQLVADSCLGFFDSIDAAVKDRKPGILLLASVLQYFEKPFELIEKCLQYDFDIIIIDRTAFIEDADDRITIQIVPEEIYKASYPSWFFNEQKFIAAFGNKYIVVNEYMSEVTKGTKLKDNKSVYWKGFIMKKVAKNE